jgi:hypothetical protein
MAKTKMSLAETHPEVAKQWHPTKNGELTPYDVRKGSNKYAWWKCPKGSDHEFKSIINSKTIESCPMCKGFKVVKSNCLATTSPEIAKQWHPMKNKNLSPKKVTKFSNKRVWWKCPNGDDHEWITSIANRSLGNGCPICSSHVLARSNSLGNLNPILSKEWHPTKNIKLTPFDVQPFSNKRVWWKCSKGSDHEWITSVNNRSKGKGCPVCEGLKIVNSNCLNTTNPEIAKQWHPRKNGKLTPFDVNKFSHKLIWWKCKVNKNHIWKASIKNRNNGTNCPYCDLTPQSRQELTITFELMKFFKNIDPKGFKTRLDGRLRAIDIYIPELNLCIEFDGSYWHKGKRELDKIKSEMLLDEGFKLIRVREEPLKKIYDTDVISKQPYNGKQVTNDILSVILNMFDLNPKLISRIKEYQSKDVLQNEKGLEKYIDQILTEKAEKQ